MHQCSFLCTNLFVAVVSNCVSNIQNGYQFLQNTHSKSIGTSSSYLYQTGNVGTHVLFQRCIHFRLEFHQQSCNLWFKLTFFRNSSTFWTFFNLFDRNSISFAFKLLQLLTTELSCCMNLSQIDESVVEFVFEFVRCIGVVVAFESENKCKWSGKEASKWCPFCVSGESTSVKSVISLCNGLENKSGDWYKYSWHIFWLQIQKHWDQHVE